MSIQFQPDDVELAVDDLEAPDDPSDIFDVLVADPSRCCQQCYRRLRARRDVAWTDGYHYGDLLSFIKMDLPEDARWELAETEYYEDAELRARTEPAHVPAAAPQAPAHDSTTACWNCGTVDHHRSPETRSRKAALEAAAGIAATLQEFGVAHNPLALLVEIGELKRDPDYAGDDYGTFRTATARAVQAGRTPPTSRTSMKPEG